MKLQTYISVGSSVLIASSAMAFQYTEDMRLKKPATVSICAPLDLYTCEGRPLSKAKIDKRHREQEAADFERNRHQRAVDSEIARLGSHRADEARRLVAMRESAERARAGSNRINLATNKLPTDGPKCSAKAQNGSVGTIFGYLTEGDAMSNLAFNAKGLCSIGQTASISGATCSRQDMAAPFIGQRKRVSNMRWGCKGAYSCSPTQPICAPSSPSNSYSR